MSNIVSLKLDHVYLCVENLDRAVKFYEAFLGMKVRTRFKDRWADFFDGKGFYLGLYNPAFDGQNYRIGNNVIAGFYTNDIASEHKRVKSLGPKSITEIFEVNFIAPYKFFQFEDPEGNAIEVALYRSWQSR